MHIASLHTLTHRHDFSLHNHRAEKRTRMVIALTAFMMAAEIAAGIVFGSMALLADGWHMGTCGGSGNRSLCLLVCPPPC